MTRYLSWDTETTVVDLDNGETPELICSVFHDPQAGPEGRSWLLGADDSVRYISERISDSDTVFVGHVIPFDFIALWTYAPQLKTRIVRELYNANRVRDTLTRQQLLDVAAGLASDSSDAGGEDGGRAVLRKINGAWVKSGLSLADLTLYHLGKNRYAEKKDPNSVRLRFGELKGMPVEQYPPEFRDYALADATDTWRVYKAQGGDALPDETRQVRSELVLRRISQRGMGVNAGRVRTLRASADKAFAELKKKMTAAGFYRAAGQLNPDSKTGREWPASKWGSKNVRVVEAAVTAAYERLGAPVPRTATGRVACDKDALLGSGDDLLKEFSGAGPLSSTVNTFLPLLETAVERGGRVHSRYNNLLATGRISSSKPNLNNIPREGGVRECFEPAKGMVLCSADYDCAELRSRGQAELLLGLRSAQAEFFQENPSGDPHLELAADILRISPTDAAERLEAGDGTVKDTRQGAKSANFGFPGGMGAAKFIVAQRRGPKRTVVTLPEALRLRKSWFKRWRPERYFAFVSRVAEERDSIDQLAPLALRPHRRRGRSPFEAHRWYSQIANTLFQGLTADGAKEALWRVWQACEVDDTNPLYGGHIVGFLYDEVIVESKAEGAHEAAMELKRLMVEGMALWTPDVPVTAKPVLSSVWSKAAKPVWAGSTLDVWTPGVL